MHNQLPPWLEQVEDEQSSESKTNLSSSSQDSAATQRAVESKGSGEPGPFSPPAQAGAKNTRKIAAETDQTQTRSSAQNKATKSSGKSTSTKNTPTRTKSAKSKSRTNQDDLSAFKVAEGAHINKRYLSVILPNKRFEELTYWVSADLDVRVGGIVGVKFGNKPYVGVVLALDIKPTFDAHKIKPIEFVHCSQYFSPEMFSTLLEAAHYYLHHRGDVFHTAMPPCLRQSHQRQVQQTIPSVELSPEALDLWTQVYKLPPSLEFSLADEMSRLDNLETSATGQPVIKDYELARAVLERQLAKLWLDFGQDEAKFEINEPSKDGAEEGADKRGKESKQEESKQEESKQEESKQAEQTQAEEKQADKNQAETLSSETKQAQESQRAEAEQARQADAALAQQIRQALAPAEALRTRPELAEPESGLSKVGEEQARDKPQQVAEESQQAAKELQQAEKDLHQATEKPQQETKAQPTSPALPTPKTHLANAFAQAFAQEQSLAARKAAGQVGAASQAELVHGEPTQLQASSASTPASAEEVAVPVELSDEAPANFSEDLTKIPKNQLTPQQRKQLILQSRVATISNAQVPNMRASIAKRKDKPDTDSFKVPVGASRTKFAQPTSNLDLTKTSAAYLQDQAKLDLEQATQHLSIKPQAVRAQTRKHKFDSTLVDVTKLDYDRSHQQKYSLGDTLDHSQAEVPEKTLEREERLNKRVQAKTRQRLEAQRKHEESNQDLVDQMLETSLARINQKAYFRGKYRGAGANSPVNDRVLADLSGELPARPEPVAREQIVQQAAAAGASKSFSGIGDLSNLQSKFAAFKQQQSQSQPHSQSAPLPQSPTSSPTSANESPFLVDDDDFDLPAATAAGMFGGSGFAHEEASANTPVSKRAKPTKTFSAGAIDAEAFFAQFDDDDDGTPPVANQAAQITAVAEDESPEAIINRALAQAEHEWKTLGQATTSDNPELKAYQALYRSEWLTQALAKQLDAQAASESVPESVSAANRQAEAANAALASKQPVKSFKEFTAWLKQHRLSRITWRLLDELASYAQIHSILQQLVALSRYKVEGTAITLESPAFKTLELLRKYLPERSSFSGKWISKLEELGLVKITSISYHCSVAEISPYSASRPVWFENMLQQVGVMLDDEQAGLTQQLQQVASLGTLAQPSQAGSLPAGQAPAGGRNAGFNPEIQAQRDALNAQIAQASAPTSVGSALQAVNQPAERRRQKAAVQTAALQARGLTNQQVDLASAALDHGEILRQLVASALDMQVVSNRQLTTKGQVTNRQTANSQASQQDNEPFGDAQASSVHDLQAGHDLQTGHDLQGARKLRNLRSGAVSAEDILVAAAHEVESHQSRVENLHAHAPVGSKYHGVSAEAQVQQFTNQDQSAVGNLVNSAASVGMNFDAQARLSDAQARLSLRQAQQHQLIRNQFVHFANVLPLNDQQQVAFNKVVSSTGYKPFLLDGVTGSGKTEVYLQIMEYYLMLGKSVLLLVPEIGLTPQTISRFQKRFKVPIEVLHSNVKDAERNRIYEHCQTGKVAIVIGTRSAIFAPLRNLGIVIIDEEHDSSYKQANDWRYHTRDLALMLCRRLEIPVLLGSATASFTSLHACAQGEFERLVLTKRAKATQDNEVILVDIRKQEFVGATKDQLRNKAGITERLWALIEDNYKAGNQTMLFLNRRGFAPQLQCTDCGYVLSCSQCDQAFTFHRDKQQLCCHRCLVGLNKPNQCPNCGSRQLLPFGAGDEQIAALMAERFGEDLVIRIDRDTSYSQATLEKNLARVHQTPRAILVGTQMLAKGHHFPDVTLVGLLNVDNLMLSKDYRAPEQLAQLYLQVAGRAGREAKKGTVVLQTSFPYEPLFGDLLSLSYYEFAKIYLAKRKDLFEPPYAYQAYVGVRVEQAKLDRLQEWGEWLQERIGALARQWGQEQQTKFKLQVRRDALMDNLAACISERVAMAVQESHGQYFAYAQQLDYQLKCGMQISPDDQQKLLELKRSILNLEQLDEIICAHLNQVLANLSSEITGASQYLEQYAAWVQSQQGQLVSDPYQANYQAYQPGQQQVNFSGLTLFVPDAVHDVLPVNWRIDPVDFKTYCEYRSSSAWLEHQLDQLHNQYASRRQAPSKYVTYADWQLMQMELPVATALSDYVRELVFPLVHDLVKHEYGLALIWEQEQIQALRKLSASSQPQTADVSSSYAANSYATSAGFNAGLANAASNPGSVAGHKPAQSQSDLFAQVKLADFYKQEDALAWLTATGSAQQVQSQPNQSSQSQQGQAQATAQAQGQAQGQGQGQNLHAQANAQVVVHGYRGVITATMLQGWFADLTSMTSTSRQTTATIFANACQRLYQTDAYLRSLQASPQQSQLNHSALYLLAQAVQLASAPAAATSTNQQAQGRVEMAQQALRYVIRIHDLGKQQNHYKHVVDFVCSHAECRHWVLEQLAQEIKESSIVRSKAYWYYDLDPTMLY